MDIFQGQSSESRTKSHSRSEPAPKKDAEHCGHFQPMFPLPKYSKHLLGNWRGTVWKYAAIPRGWLHFSAATVLAGLYVMLLKELDKRQVDSAENSTNIEEIDEDAPLTYKGLEVLLQNAIWQAGAGRQEGVDWNWDRPYPYQVFAFILGFLLVFRTNIAYQRFWEGCTMLQRFTGKLTDVVHLALALDNYNVSRYDISGSKHHNQITEFDRILARQKAQKALDPEQSECEANGFHQKEEGDQENKMSEAEAQKALQDLREELELGKQKFKNTLCHLVSLLHAVGLSTLRDDHNMANIITHFTGHPIESKSYMSETSDPDKYAFLNDLLDPKKKKEYQAQMDVEELEQSVARQVNHFDSVVYRQRWLGHVAETAKDAQKKAEKVAADHGSSQAGSEVKKTTDFVRLFALPYWKSWRIFRNRTVDDTDTDDVPQAPLDGEVTFIPHKKIIPAPKKPKKEPLGYTVTRAVWTAGNRVVYDLMYKDLLKKKLWKLAHLLGDATTSVAEWLWNVLVRNTTTWILDGDAEYLQKMHKRNKLHVIGGMSMAEGISLGAQATDHRCHEIWRWHTEDMNHRAQCIQWLAGVADHEKSSPGHVGGLSMRYLPSARERTQVVHAWINQIIVERMCLEPYAMDTSDTSMRSRVTAYLSDAMDAYEQCKKLTQVQLPYAWYQCCHLCLTFLTLTLPFVAAFWMREYWLAMPTAGFTVLLFATMNEIANAIEEPFKFYPPLIPLMLRQWQFNERLIAISNTRRPLGFADVLRDVNDPRGYLQLKRARFREATVYAGKMIHPHEDARKDMKELHRELGSTCSVEPTLKDGTSRALLDYTYSDTLPVPEAFMMYRTGDLDVCRFSHSIKRTLVRRNEVWTERRTLFNLTDEFDKAVSSGRKILKEGTTDAAAKYKDWALEKELIMPLRCMVAPSPLFIASDRKREEHGVGLYLTNGRSQEIRARTQTGWTKLARSMLQTPVRQETENLGWIGAYGADPKSRTQAQAASSRFGSARVPDSLQSISYHMPATGPALGTSPIAGGSSGGSSMDSGIPAMQFDNPAYEPQQEGTVVTASSDDALASSVSQTKPKKKRVELITQRVSFTDANDYKPGVNKSAFDIPDDGSSSSAMDSDDSDLASKKKGIMGALLWVSRKTRSASPTPSEAPPSPRSAYNPAPSGHKLRKDRHTSSSSKPHSGSAQPQGTTGSPCVSPAAPKAIIPPPNALSNPRGGHSSAKAAINSASGSSSAVDPKTERVPSNGSPQIHSQSNAPSRSHSNSRSLEAPKSLRERYGVSPEQSVTPIATGMYQTGGPTSGLRTSRSANSVESSQPPRHTGSLAATQGRPLMHPSAHYTLSSGIESSADSSQRVSGALSELPPTQASLRASVAGHQHSSGPSHQPHNSQEQSLHSTGMSCNAARAHSPQQLVSATGAAQNALKGHLEGRKLRSASDVYGPRSKTKSPERLLPNASPSPPGVSSTLVLDYHARGASPPRPGTPNPPWENTERTFSDGTHALESHPVNHVSRTAAQQSHGNSSPPSSRLGAPTSGLVPSGQSGVGLSRGYYQRPPSYYGS